jgi:hypothetical protein
VARARFATRSAADVIELGQRVLAARKKLGPRFGKWLSEEFGEERETARKCAQAVAVLGDQFPSDLPIAVSAVYLLSKSHVPDAIRAQVIERAEAGERISHRIVAALVRTATGRGGRG